MKRDLVGTVAAQVLCGLLSRNPCYTVRVEDLGLPWHQAIAKEALDLTEALVREANARLYSDQ